MSDIAYVVRKGFIQTVRAPLATLIGDRCSCYDHHLEQDPPYTPYPRCRYCHGTWQTPGIAAKIVECQPVQVWVASDKEPLCQDGRWHWYRADDEQDDYRIRYDLFQHFGQEEQYGLMWIAFYPTRQAALDALSSAIHAYATAPQTATLVHT